ncbi:MAG TPA: hypothetical protein VJO33_03845 [Gemmatimonadaceae bacterium]|nr:hypothetical protein [Gemmatimonadaceae bacterium]
MRLRSNTTSPLLHESRAIVEPSCYRNRSELRTAKYRAFGNQRTELHAVMRGSVLLHEVNERTLPLLDERLEIRVALLAFATRLFLPESIAQGLERVRVPSIDEIT